MGMCEVKKSSADTDTKDRTTACAKEDLMQDIFDAKFFGDGQFAHKCPVGA